MINRQIAPQKSVIPPTTLSKDALPSCFMLLVTEGIEAGEEQGPNLERRHLSPT